MVIKENTKAAVVLTLKEYWEFRQLAMKVKEYFTLDRITSTTVEVVAEKEFLSEVGYI